MTTTEQRIAELESLLAKQKAELESLKQELKVKQEPDLSPYSGPGYYPTLDQPESVALTDYPNGKTIRCYARYPTKKQAEWQFKSEVAIRKLQHLMLRLNPKGWTPASQEHGWYNIPVQAGIQYVGFFHSVDARDKAKKEMGDDLQYLDWFNSPQAKGE